MIANVARALDVAVCYQIGCGGVAPGDEEQRGNVIDRALLIELYWYNSRNTAVLLSCHTLFTVQYDSTSSSILVGLVCFCRLSANETRIYTMILIY